MADYLLKDIVKSKHSATMFLKRQCWENYRRYCIRCRSYNLYKLADKRYRCKRCGYTFHDFSGRWLNKCKANSQHWLTIIDLFVSETPARKISESVGLSYPTILKALELIRLSIIANTVESPKWLDRLYFNPCGIIATPLSPTTFGIREEGRFVQTDWLDNISISTISSLSPKLLRQSAIIYTEAYPPYSFLLLHSDQPARIQLPDITDNIVRPTDSRSTYWLFLNNRFAKHRGISGEKLPLYLKESEFRFNHRQQSVFEDLCRYLVSQIPRS